MAMTTSALEWFWMLKGKEFHGRIFSREFTEENILNVGCGSRGGIDREARVGCNYMGEYTAGKFQKLSDESVIMREAWWDSDEFIHSGF